MDWGKVGEAFQNAANIYSSGLMSEYQRKKDLEDWEQKQRLATQIQMGKEERAEGRRIDSEQRNMTRKAIEAELKSNPELVPVWQRANEGDEEAQNVMQLYAGARYMMDSKTPLSSEQIAELKGLPPQTRHSIINQHLNALNAEVKRKADLARTEAETKYRMTLGEKARFDLDKAVSEKGQEGATEAAKMGAKDLAEKIKKRDEARKALDQLNNTIIPTLEAAFAEKSRRVAMVKIKRPKDNKSKDPKYDEYDAASMAAAAVGDRLDRAKTKATEIESRLQKEASEQLPGVVPEPEEPPAEAAGLKEEYQQVLYEMDPWNPDRAEIFALMKSRKDLTPDQCFEIYLLYKQEEQKKALAAKQATAAGMRIK